MRATPKPSLATAGRPFVWLQATLILFSGWLVFAPALHGTWLWDDAAEITANVALRDAQGLRDLWLHPAGPDYFPLKSSVQWVEWHLWGDQVLGYHLVSLTLHLVSAFLLWHLLTQLGLRWGWLGGLLFAIHPLAVESVAWIAELKNTLSLPLLLLAMSAYLRFERRGRRRDYVFSLGGFLAALLCKTSGVMLPAVLLLMAWQGRRDVRRTWIRTVPFFALSLLLGVVTVWFQSHRVIAHLAMPVESLGHRIAGAGSAIAFYFGKALWPFDLLPIYPRWPLSPSPLWQIAPWAGLALLLGWCWRRRNSWGRTALLALGFFLLNLAPVLGLVPMAFLRIARVSDHLVYLPLIGLIGLTVAGAEQILGRVGRSGQKAALAAIAAICLLLGRQSRSYAAQFAHDETLWRYTLARNPQAWLAHNNLAQDLMAEGQIGEALMHSAEAVRLQPENAEGRSNFGFVLFAAGRLPAAIAECEAAVRLRPELAGAHLNLSRALLASDQTARAAAEAAEALRLDPHSAPAYDAAGMAHARLAEWDDAIAAYTSALHENPQDAEAHTDWGSALGHLGRFPEAIGHYEAALRLRPDLAPARNNLANALASTGHLPEAVGEYRQALVLDPRNANTRRNLGIALRSLGLTAEAQSQFAEAAKLEGHP